MIEHANSCDIVRYRGHEILGFFGISLKFVRILCDIGSELVLILAIQTRKSYDQSPAHENGRT